MSLATKTQPDAMNVLLTLEERVRMSGAMLPRSVDARERWSGLRCSIAGLNCILALNDVAEILENRALTPIPGCAPWVKGVVNLRGRLLPVFGINDFFSAGDKTDALCQVVVVDKGRLFCGLAVNRIYGMRKFYRDSFCPMPDGAAPAPDGPLQIMSEFIDSVAVFDDDSWYQLNLESLARKIIQTSPA